MTSFQKTLQSDVFSKVVTPYIGISRIAKGVKKPAFIPFLTKVEDIFLVRPVYIDGKQFIEFDVSLAATLLCGDGIKAVLATDGMGVSIQRGVYASFFTNMRYLKDLGNA